MLVVTAVIEDKQVDKSDFDGKAQLGMDSCLRRNDDRGAEMTIRHRGGGCLRVILANAGIHGCAWPASLRRGSNSVGCVRLQCLR